METKIMGNRIYVGLINKNWKKVKSETWGRYRKAKKNPGRSKKSPSDQIIKLDAFLNKI